MNFVIEWTKIEKKTKLKKKNFRLCYEKKIGERTHSLFFYSLYCKQKKRATQFINILLWFIVFEDQTNQILTINIFYKFLQARAIFTRMKAACVCRIRLLKREFAVLFTRKIHGAFGFFLLPCAFIFLFLIWRRYVMLTSRWRVI